MSAAGRSKSKGKGKGAEPRETRISKALTQVLRHKAVDLGLPIEKDGYIPLEDVLACKLVSKFKATLQDVQEITRTSDKQRFELKLDRMGAPHIRAVQGHSIKVVDDSQLMRALKADDPDLPRDCVHGTFRRHLQDILKQGLKAGGKLGQVFRNHVHFVPYAPGDQRVISGMRYNTELAIWVDLPKALRAGVPFFLSKNQVILSPGLDGGVVPKEFFLRIKDLESGVVVWPPDEADAAGASDPAPAPAAADSPAGGAGAAKPRRWGIRNKALERAPVSPAEGADVAGASDTALASAPMEIPVDVKGADEIRRSDELCAPLRRRRWTTPAGQGGLEDRAGRPPGT